MPNTGTTVLAADVQLNIRQGSECTWALRYSEQNPDGSTVTNTYTGWSARAQIRDRVGGAVWLSMTSPTSITLTAAANKLTVAGRIDHSVTEATAWNSRSVGLWDVELVRADGTVVPLAAGRVLVDHDVTRDA